MRILILFICVLVFSGCATNQSKYKPNTLVLVKQADEAYKQRNWMVAATTYRMITRIAPKDYYAFFRLGNVLAKQTHFGKAAAAYREALIRRPNFGKAYHNLAMVRLLQAEYALKDAVKRYPKHEKRLPLIKRLYAHVKMINREPGKVVAKKTKEKFKKINKNTKTKKYSKKRSTKKLKLDTETDWTWD